MHHFTSLIFLLFSIYTATAQELVALMPRDADCGCKPSLSQRDLATITSAFSSVGSGIVALDTAVSGLDGASDIAPLQAASTQLIDAIKSGTASVQAASPLSLQESVQLQQVVTGLQRQGESLAGTLASKKSTIERLRLCKIFQAQASSVATASKGLSDAVVGKVPEAARTIAAELASGFTGTLDKTRAVFAEGNCTNSAQGSGSGAGGASGGGAGAGGAARNGTVVTAGASGLVERFALSGHVGAIMVGFFVLGFF